MAKPEALPSIEKCDVLDRASCAQFRGLRTRVYNMLVGEDEHSVHFQITGLLWRDYTWRAVNEARRWAVKDNRELNETLLELIDEGFVANQSLAVRRLVERKNRNEKRAVYSLVTAIDELLEHAHLLTRENIICYGGARFDGSGATHQDGLSRLAHHAFNSVCELPIGARHDRVSVKFLEDLRGSFGPCERMVELSHKRLAHASAPGNRTSGLGFSLDDLDAAYQAIITAAQALSTRVLFGPHTVFFPMTTTDVLESINEPLLPPRHEPKVRAWSEARMKLYRKWDNAKLGQAKAAPTPGAS